MEAVAIFLKSFQSLHEYNIHYSYWNWRFSFLNDYMGPSQIMLNMLLHLEQYQCFITNSNLF